MIKHTKQPQLRDHGIDYDTGSGRHVNAFYTMQEFLTRQHLVHGEGRRDLTIKMRLYIRNRSRNLELRMH
jgi:hypothetical protein